MNFSRVSLSSFLVMTPEPLPSMLIKALDRSFQRTWAFSVKISWTCSALIGLASLVALNLEYNGNYAELKIVK